jgi:hypothetical protein
LGGEYRGFDGGKMIKRRKRYIIRDTMGLLLTVVVHAANVHESKFTVISKTWVADRMFVWVESCRKLSKIPITLNNAIRQFQFLKQHWENFMPSQ